MTVVNEAPSAFRSSAYRPGPREHLTTAAAEIYTRRRLIAYMVRAHVRKKGADTLLGNLWWILDPLAAMLVYVLVMTVIFQRSTPDFPLFLLAAMVPFKWATATIGGSTGAVVSHERLIKQIMFPKIILPITTAGGEIVSFAFGMLVLGGVLVIGFAAHLSLMLLWVPLIAMVQFIFILGIAIMVSAVTVFYRDVGIVIGHFMRLLFWVSPILWSFDAALGRGEALREALGETGFTILAYNPISILLTTYRHVIYGKLTLGPDGPAWTAPVAPDLQLLGAVLATGLVLLVLGVLVFKRLEPAFAKVL